MDRNHHPPTVASDSERKVAYARGRLCHRRYRQSVSRYRPYTIYSWGSWAGSVQGNQQPPYYRWTLLRDGKSNLPPDAQCGEVQLISLTTANRLKFHAKGSSALCSVEFTTTVARTYRLTGLQGVSCALQISLQPCQGCCVQSRGSTFWTASAVRMTNWTSFSDSGPQRPINSWNPL